MTLRISLIGFACLFSIGLSAQREREQQALDLIEKRIEYLMQSFEESDLDFTTLFDDLYFLYENPLNLNAATREELENTYLLNDYQTTQLLLYRDKYGLIQTQYELIHIPGFDKTTIDLLLPFVKVGPVEKKSKFPIKSAFKYGRSELILRHTRIFPESVGYASVSDSVLAENPNARYLGSPDRLYVRYRFTYGKKLSIGITGEKDPGEEFFRGSQKNGFDFYSGHIFLRDLGPIKQLALGDYHLQVGQGLTFWSGFGFRKSPSQTVATKRFAQVLRPYTSTDENNFMRGAAATLNYQFVDLTLFYSNKGIDGNLQYIPDTTDREQIGSFSSIQSTGLHRTPSELEDKNAIKEVIYGAALDFNLKDGKIGLLAVQSSFDPELDRNLQHYQRFEFEGKENFNAGLNYQFNLNKFNFFGEGAISKNTNYPLIYGDSSFTPYSNQFPEGYQPNNVLKNTEGVAMLNGVIMNLDPRFKATILHRYYGPDYQSLYADAFGERSGVKNESGFYFGAEFLPIKFVSVSAFYDMYKFPWLSNGIDKPGKGNEFSGQIIINPMRKLEFLFLYRNESKDKNYNPLNEAINPVEVERRQRYRFQITAKVNRFVTMRTRFETSKYHLANNANDLGYLLYQDLYIDGFSSKLALKFRYALFDTKDYNTRIYAYENDLRYQFYVPAYYLKGSRVYMVVRWKLAKFTTFNFKISQTFLANEDHFGSGKDLINSDTRTEIKSQLIFKF
ncbi:MAG: hypothetical protein CL840_13340 [Crocinitomicaceae bacterium]|nr:hypothetical protein [Crocinitomicaceae bacterium]